MIPSDLYLMHKIVRIDYDR